MTARYSAHDYARAAAALLPRGRIWHGEPGTVQGDTLEAICLSFERSDAAAMQLLGESLPGEALALLPEWETSLGLPDPCVGADATTTQRQGQVRARFVGGGGQSRSRYIEFSADLGFDIAISVYSPFTIGGAVGRPLASEAWRFAWGVTVLANHGGLTSSVLRCELEAVKPAETTIILLS